MTASIHIPNSARRFPFLSILANSCYLLSFCLRTQAEQWQHSSGDVNETPTHDTGSGTVQQCSVDSGWKPWLSTQGGWGQTTSSMALVMASHSCDLELGGWVAMHWQLHYTTGGVVPILESKAQSELGLTSLTSATAPPLRRKHNHRDSR